MGSWQHASRIRPALVSFFPLRKGGSRRFRRGVLFTRAHAGTPLLLPPASSVLEAIAIIGLTVAAFVSTGMDNLLLLIGFKGQPSVSDRHVNLGFLGAFLLILLIGFGASYAADFLPSRYTGYLGVVPLSMGIFRLAQTFRGRGGGPTLGPVTILGPWTVGLVMLANNGDSLAVLTSLFAETREPFTFLIVGTGLCMVLLWSRLAGWIARHPRLEGPIRKWSHPCCRSSSSRLGGKS